MSPILHYFCKLFDYCMVNLSILSKFRNFLSFPDMSQVKHIIEHRVATPKQYQLPPIQNPPQAPVTYPQPYPQHIIQQVPQPVVQNLVPDQRQGMFNKGGKWLLHPYTSHVLIRCTCTDNHDSKRANQLFINLSFQLFCNYRRSTHSFQVLGKNFWDGIKYV